MSLDLSGLIDKKKEVSSESKPKKNTRKLIGLEFTLVNPDHYYALDHWKKSKLASPLIWVIIDEIGRRGNYSPKEIQEIIGRGSADKLIEDVINMLREKHK